MVDYIHPIRDLQGSLRRSHQIIILLGALLAIAILAVPSILGKGPVLVIDEGTFARKIHAQPWRLTVSRAEEFIRQYLVNRWEWAPEDFETRRKALEEITLPATFTKFKDSLTQFESLAKLQKARSYFVLETWAFSNGERRIEAHIDRVIRIGTAAFVTPLIVRMIFQEAAVTDPNPLGLKIESLEEIEEAAGVGK